MAWKPGGFYKVRVPPKTEVLDNTNIEQDESVRCDTRVGSKTKEIKEERNYLILVVD